jgi:FkbH-like protein
MSQIETEPARQAREEESAKQVVKVLVWDLDDTLWSGTLLEGDDVRLRPGVLETLQALDARGILHSIASRNDAEAALARLRELGVAEFFLYPQIHWNAKSQSVRAIAEAINVGVDALAFIDDQPFERDEVRGALPEVLTLDAAEAASLAERPEFMPRFITDESARRRLMYRADAERARDEAAFVGPSEEFLAGLGMRFSIAPALEEDLRRAEELTVRTNQLNSTGYTYSYDELAAFRRSSQHLLLVAGLEDRYGPYGKIGLVLIEKGAELWTLKLLLMSCRVISRGVGAVLMNHVLGLARAAGVRLQAEFRNTGRNRMMLVSYKFAGFKEVGRRGDELICFEHALENLTPPPPWMEMNVAPLA